MQGESPILWCDQGKELQAVDDHTWSLTHHWTPAHFEGSPTYGAFTARPLLCSSLFSGTASGRLTWKPLNKYLLTEWKGGREEKDMMGGHMAGGPLRYDCNENIRLYVGD